MRVWDIPLSRLCRKHLVAQHAEIHAIHSIITKDKAGYAHHPEVLRWRGHVMGLRQKHDDTAREMILRGFNHKSPLEGYRSWRFMPAPIEPVKKQEKKLKAKRCPCAV